MSTFNPKSGLRGSVSVEYFFCLFSVVFDHYGVQCTVHSSSLYFSRLYSKQCMIERHLFLYGQVRERTMSVFFGLAMCLNYNTACRQVVQGNFLGARFSRVGTPCAAGYSVLSPQALGSVRLPEVGEKKVEKKPEKVKPLPATPRKREAQEVTKLGLLEHHRLRRPALYTGAVWISCQRSAALTATNVPR